MVNRAALVVRPAQPYLDWAVAHGAFGIRPDLDNPDSQTVYLIPVFVSNDEAEEILQTIYAALFEDELVAWCIDEATWPEQRDFETFKKWFHVDFHSVVMDLCAYGVMDEGASGEGEDTE